MATGGSAILRRRTVSPATERLATKSRAYLLLIVGGALIAAVPTTVYVLFRSIDAFLGGGATAIGSDLALPVAIVSVAVLAAAYHGRLVVSDLRLAAAARPTAVAPLAVPETVATPAIGAAPTMLALVLRGQGGEDLEAVAGGLRKHLPPGIVLEGG